MVKKLEDLIDLNDPKISEAVRAMIRRLPDIGKQALAAFYDEDSEFYRHARPEIIAKRFYLDTNIDGNKFIYHYTSVDGLKKILNSKVFYVKEKSYLNDPSEYQYAFHLAIEELEKMGATQHEINFFREHVADVPFSDLYIWSFTRNGESQTLFGNYNGGSHDGVALKFDSQVMQEQLANHFSHGKKSLEEYTVGNAFVFPLVVVYERSEQLAYLCPVMKEWIMAYRSRSFDEYDMVEIMKNCLQALSLFAMCFKNPLLRQEEEVRFLVLNINGDNKNHPEITINNVPFMKCEFTPMMLQAVTLQTNAATNLNELKEVVGEAGFHSTEVKQSVLPY